MKIIHDQRNRLTTILIILLFQTTVYAQQPVSLLVRADDMGVTYDVSQAVIKAYQEGILTSASLMPTSAFFDESVRMCKENPGLAIGLHLTLLGTRERPILPPGKIPSLVTKKGFFYETLEQLENADPCPA